jgi:uncharacterized membrane protein
MKNGSTLYKVICWRVISILITVVAITIATGDPEEATRLTIFLHLILTITHYFFEKLWDKKEVT